MVKKLSRERKDFIQTILPEVSNILNRSLTKSYHDLYSVSLVCASFTNNSRLRHVIQGIALIGHSFLYVFLSLHQVILCTKEVAVKAKNAAFDLISDIGTALVFLSDKSKEGIRSSYIPPSRCDRKPLFDSLSKNPSTLTQRRVKVFFSAKDDIAPANKSSNIFGS